MPHKALSDWNCLWSKTEILSFRDHESDSIHCKPSMLSHHLILCYILILLPSILPINWLSRWIGSLNQVAKIMQLQKQWIFRVDFLSDWLVWSLCSPRDSQSLLQHHSSKASILWRSAFFMVQQSHPCMTTGKTIALTRQTLVGKVMSLLFNMLSWLVIAFLPRSKSLLISWLQSPSSMILEPKKIKSVSVSIVSSSICHEVMGPDARMLVFWMLSFKPIFHSPLSLSWRDSLVLLRFLP